MTVLDERGEPVVVEYIAPGWYLASGWFGGVGRYAAGHDDRQALLNWRSGWFLPKRDRGDPVSEAEAIDGAFQASMRFDPAEAAKAIEEARRLLQRLSDEKPGERPEKEE